MSALPKPPYTVEEYIELDKHSEDRYEYFDGEIVSMAGGSIEHGAITVNVAGTLRERLRDRQCLVLSGDVRLRVPAAFPYRYPDVSIVCGQIIREEILGQVMLVNPLLIVEVLSPSTENYDREAKFLAYQSIESFQEYLLIAQQRPHVTQYIRQPDGRWLRADLEGLEATITLSSLDVSLPLSEIYRMVDFEQSEKSSPVS
ncbi:MAG: Uma2 family endonuclease [Blastocatellia bacterium]